jgi:ribosome modulation factor
MNNLLLHLIFFLQKKNIYNYLLHYLIKHNRLNLEGTYLINKCLYKKEKNMEYSELLSTAKLVLEVQLPSLEQCWSDGYGMSISGSLDDNPYAAGTASHSHWQEGWWTGFYENELIDETGSGICFSEASNDNSIRSEKLIKHQSGLQTKQLTNRIASE